MYSHEQPPPLAEESAKQEAANKLSELQALWQAATNADLVGNYDKWALKAKELVAKYGSKACDGCRLWHLLTGSGMLAAPTSFDLGDGEIEKFLREEIRG